MANEGERAGPPAMQEPRVPPLLATLAAWSWRLLFIGVLGYVLIRIVGMLQLAIFPVVVALLLCGLLRPVVGWLQRVGLNALLATWGAILLALAVLGGAGTLVGIRANAEFPELTSQLARTAQDVQHWLVTGPLQMQQAELDQAVDTLLQEVNQQRNQIVAAVVSGAGVAAEVLVGVILVFFVTFFLLKDGDLIWSWFVRLLGGAGEPVDRAGQAAWATLSQYVRGTVIVAAINAAVLGAVLWIMGVPLVAPLTLLIFFGSFIPIVGITVTGGLAVLVTLSTQGLIAALVFLGILLVEQQLESHVLQPQVVGRLIRLHPLAIILTITVGTMLGGIPGAVVAVPIVAVLYRALPELFPRQREGTPPPVEDGGSSSDKRTEPVLLRQTRRAAVGIGRLARRWRDRRSAGHTSRAPDEPTGPSEATPEQG